MKSQKYDMTAVILAGGLSKRMGYSKEFIKLDNEYLIHQSIRKLEELFNEVIVISNNPDFYKDLPCRVEQDIIKKKSPLVGLHAGLKHAKYNYIYLLACDMPNISTMYINDTISKIKDYDAYIPKLGEYFDPFHGFYHKRILEQLESFLTENAKFQDFISTINHYPVTSGEYLTEELFQNLNTPDDLLEIQYNSNEVEVMNISKYGEFNQKELDDYVITEYPITLYINNNRYVTLLVTPNHIKELVLGYMKSEKLIDSITDIKNVDIDLDKYRADVITNIPINQEEYSKDKLLTSGCGVGTRFHQDLDDLVLAALDNDTKIHYEDIIKASKILNNESGLFKLTGGVHSCLLFINNKEYYFEDIGRHNAVDKAMGHILINDLDTTNSYIISSGRISSDMLIKCAVSKVPIAISRSAPTSLAVALARKMGVTLIGFVRGNKFNVYSGKERVVR